MNRRFLPLLLIFAPVWSLLFSNPVVTADLPKIPGLLVFAATEGDNWDLFTWSGEGRNELIRLTETPYDERAPALSYDRKKVAYVTSGDKLFIHDLETNQGGIT